MKQYAKQREYNIMTTTPYDFKAGIAQQPFFCPVCEGTDVKIAVATIKTLKARIAKAIDFLSHEIDGDSPAWDGTISEAIRILEGE